MSTPATNPVPADMNTVTAHIICAGASDAIEFYKKAFNAVELARRPGENGKLMHAMIKIGDTNIMMADENPEWKAFGPKALGGSSVTLHMYVPDVDASFKQAVDAGGTATMPPTDMFWGDRYGMVTDPFGHNWAIASHIRDMSIEEMTQAAKAGCP